MNTANKGRLQGDLAYVRDVVNKTERVPNHPLICLLWAVLTLVGFTLVDADPERAGTFWSIAAPVGVVLSGIIGWWSTRHSGERERREGLKRAAHWGSMLLVLGLAGVLMSLDKVQPDAFGALILLILGLSYLLAGVHSERALLIPGVVLLGGFPLVLFVGGRTWTILGVIVAVALVLTAFSAHRSRSAQGN